MQKNKMVRVTEEELALIRSIRENAKAGDPPLVPEQPAEAVPDAVAKAQKALAEAFVEAIERTKPAAKITIANRKPRTPWHSDTTVPRSKMKRKFYHHGLIIEDKVTNEEIDLLNRVKPGRFCDGHVVVTLRKDRGIDIDYPVRTAAQRLKLVNTYGIRSFTELLQRVVDEKAFPTKYRSAVDKDLYDLED